MKFYLYFHWHTLFCMRVQKCAVPLLEFVHVNMFLKMFLGNHLSIKIVWKQGPTYRWTSLNRKFILDNFRSTEMPPWRQCDANVKQLCAIMTSPGWQCDSIVTIMTCHCDTYVTALWCFRHGTVTQVLCLSEPVWR